VVYLVYMGRRGRQRAEVERSQAREPRDRMARVQASDEMWAAFRAQLGVTPVSVALGRLVEREVGRNASPGRSRGASWPSWGSFFGLLLVHSWSTADSRLPNHQKTAATPAHHTIQRPITTISASPGPRSWMAAVTTSYCLHGPRWVVRGRRLRRKAGARACASSSTSARSVRIRGRPRRGEAPSRRMRPSQRLALSMPPSDTEVRRSAPGSWRIRLPVLADLELVGGGGCIDAAWSDGAHIEHVAARLQVLERLRRAARGVGGRRCFRALAGRLAN
jgi:hypothetical protein